MKLIRKRQTYCTVIGVKKSPMLEITEKTCKLHEVDNCMLAIGKRFETVFVASTYVGFDDNT